MRDNDILREIADRVRRFETKLTRFMAATGFETGGRKPVVVQAEDGYAEILAPNAAASVVDCVAALVEATNSEEAVPVTFNGDVIGYVSRP